MKRELKARSYAEAAQVLRVEMDAIDLPPDLSEAEEAEMREFIRNEIADALDAMGARLAQRIRSPK